MKSFFLLFSFCFLMFCGTAKAQPLQFGDAVGTCFSGSVASQGKQDPNMEVLIFMHVQNANTEPVNTNWGDPAIRVMNYQWKAQSLGEIFGIAIDKRGDVFVTAIVYPATCTVFSKKIIGSSAFMVYERLICDDWFSCS